MLTPIFSVLANVCYLDEISSKFWNSMVWQIHSVWGTDLWNVVKGHMALIKRRVLQDYSIKSIHKCIKRAFSHMCGKCLKCKLLTFLQEAYFLERIKVNSKVLADSCPDGMRKVFLLKGIDFLFGKGCRHGMLWNCKYANYMM